MLVVGDSLEELTSPHLAKFLPGVPLTINAVGGYNSYQIFDLFQESYDPSQRVIVFDAGTNDNPSYPQILAGNLAKVAAIVGDRCMVVPTIHGLHPGGVDDSGKNQVVREFAASRPGTQTPDWQRAVFRHPELMQADDLHPIEAGAELRARLIAQRGDGLSRLWVGGDRRERVVARAGPGGGAGADSAGARDGAARSGGQPGDRRRAAAPNRCPRGRRHSLSWGRVGAHFLQSVRNASQLFVYAAIIMEAMREAWTDERLDDLVQHMDQGFDRLTREMDGRFARVETDARELRTEMDARFARVDDRFDRIEVRFEGLEERITSRFEWLWRLMLASYVTMFLGFLATQL